MAYVETIPETAATGETARIYEDMRARFGMVPGLFRLMSADPTILREVWKAYPYAMEYGSLGRVERELLGLAVSRVLACRYCADGATRRLLDMGMTRPQIDDVFAAAAAEEPEGPDAALISLAENATRDPYRSLRPFVLRAQEAGCDAQQVREAATVVVWFNLLTRLVDGLGVPHELRPRRGSIQSLRMVAQGVAARLWRSESLPVVEAVQESGAGETAVVILQKLLDWLEPMPPSLPAAFSEGILSNPRQIRRALVDQMREGGMDDRTIFRAAFLLAGREALLYWDAIVLECSDPLSGEMPGI